MKSARAEHRSRNSVFEFEFVPFFCSIISMLWRLVLSRSQKYNTRRATPAQDFSTMKLELGSTVIEGNIHLAVMQVLARLFHIRKTQV
jgi:hypothetical protein